jgi:DNA repair exonuclease SbcCD ATPase subunit
VLVLAPPNLVSHRRKEIALAAWDLVIIDEAHHARRTLERDGYYDSTNLYRLAELVDALAKAHLAVTAEHSTAVDRARGLATRLAERQKLESEIEEQRERAAVYDELAYDLRQDRLVAFLQDQALQILAGTGTRDLEELSSGRYGLRFSKQTFSVVDRWNGGEERSVRTLSGGETFSCFAVACTGAVGAGPCIVHYGTRAARQPLS